MDCGHACRWRCVLSNDELPDLYGLARAGACSDELRELDRDGWLDKGGGWFAKGDSRHVKAGIRVMADGSGSARGTGLWGPLERQS